MAGILNETVEFFSVLSDPRTSVLPLVGSPLPVVAIVILYYLTVTKWGPAYMKNRKPFQLDRIVQLYNIVQVLVCGYITFVTFTEYYSPWGKYNWICEPVNLEVTPETTRAIFICYIYYLTKYFDLLDTVFFVLRKKQKQISFLHLYHHAVMIGIIYAGTKFVPGGSGLFFVAMNTMVHTVMYTYYLLSNMFKGNQIVLKMKKHITQLQLFAMLALHWFAQLIFTPDCKYPRNFVLMVLAQNLFIMALFAFFYKKTYSKTEKTK